MGRSIGLQMSQIGACCTKKENYITLSAYIKGFKTHLQLTTFGPFL
jgi:hypothetical protein